jgi:tetratricopeptide (TPR) repeat protein
VVTYNLRVEKWCQNRVQETIMADDTAMLPSLSPEQRRVAAGQFERANQVIATGNHDYGIELLLNCCQLDPANLVYRHTLRHTEKNKYKHNLRGSRLAFLTTSPAKARVKAALHAHDYLKVLELGELVLVRNPWDTGAQMDMAEAAEKLDLLDLAAWLLEQARQKNPNDVTVNRRLARLLEKRGNFGQAMKLWELIRAARPTDLEASNKAKDLAASATIARGHYDDVVGGATDEESEEASTDDEPDEAGSAPGIATATDRISQEVARYRAQIQREPAAVSGYLNLADVHRRAGQFDQARAILEEGLGPTGRNFELTTAIAELEIEPFRQNLAVVEIKTRSDPNDEELRTMRLRLLKEINTRELELYRQKSDHYPTDKGLRFEMGVRLLRAGQVDEAIKELQGVRNDPRHHWKAVLFLGYCFKSRNNWRLAERNFEEALKSLPVGDVGPKKEVLFQLAQGSANAGDLAKAVEIGYELANLDFNYHDIGNLIDQWQARMAQADVSS